MGALLLHWLGVWGGLALAAAAVFFNATLLDRVTGGRVVRPAERTRGLRPTVLYPLMLLVLTICLPGRLELVAAVWGVLAFGDAAAGLAGRGVGGRALPWNPRKHWSGLIAFVVVSLPVAAFLVRWTQAGDAAAIGTAFGGVHGSATWLLTACAASAVAAAVAESLDSLVDDNVLVPLAAAATLLAAAAVDPSGLQQAWIVGVSRAPGVAVLAVAALGALAVGAASPSGAVVGWILSTALLTFAGWPAILVLAAVVGVGAGATRLGYRHKEASGLAQERGGRRGFSHALANLGAGTVFGVLVACGSAPRLYSLAMVAAFAAAAFDTSASEVGQLLGRTHILPTTLRRVPPGTEGAVSLEGTLGGTLGAAVVIGVAAGGALLGWTGAACALTGAFAGAMLESVAGASMPRQHPVDNHLLNLGTTLAGAGVAVALRVLVR